MSRPRAVRNQPCGHGVFCELCTIKSVKADGLISCAYARCTVRRLVVVPATPTRILDDDAGEEGRRFKGTTE